MSLIKNNAVQNRRLWWLKYYKYSFHVVEKLRRALCVVLIGFWLGVLPRNKIYELDESYYNGEAEYFTDEHNASGLQQWEGEVIERYFQDSKKILVLAAGGGREIYSLHRMNFAVDGFECNPKLIEFGNDFLERQKIPVHIAQMGRDECPVTKNLYDGAIIGWGAYMLIQRRSKRIKLLSDIKKQLKPGGPVLLSFFVRNEKTKSFARIAKITNFIRFFSNREYVEVGDSLLPGLNYVHFFNQDEIQNEMQKAGFELRFYQTKPYGHAVGISGGT